MASSSDGDWIGCLVSVDCGDIVGSFQGEVDNVDRYEQTITLRKVFRNGLKCDQPRVTIRAEDIRSLSILKPVTSPSNLDREESIIDSTQRPCPAVDISNSNGRKKPPQFPPQAPTRSRQAAANRSDDDCLTAPISSFILENDFDFEKNLALFKKKRPVFEKTSAANASSSKSRKPRQGPQNLRCDEDVLDRHPVELRRIRVPSPGNKCYVTDAGLVVPSITPQLRAKLLRTAADLGISRARQMENMGRSAAEMTLQLLGGSRRLDPCNAHQKPTVIVLCGDHVQGAQAANCARHLANHNVEVVLFVPAPTLTGRDDLLADELASYRLTDGKLTSEPSEDLPSGPVDMIVNGLDNAYGTVEENSTARWYREVIKWCAACKAPVLALDPPAQRLPISTKWCLAAALPQSYDDTAGSIYLCDVSIPQKAFSHVGISYSSPFGSKFVIPLHPAE